MKTKIIRITTVPESLGGLLKGQLHFMSKHYEIIGVSSSGNKLLEKVGKQEGIRVVPIEMTRKITPLKDLLATWKLYKLFRKERPVIVHTHTPKAGTLGMLAAYLAKVPYRLHTIAGLPLLEAKGNKRILLDMVEKLTYACATKVYPNSHGLKKIVLKNKYTTENRIKVIGNGSSNGINTSYFDPTLYTPEDKLSLRNSLGLQKKDFVYIFVGRLVKDKGLNELIQAFKQLCGEHANVKLLLVGPFENDLDPLMPETKSFISQCDQILALGWQDDVRPYFSISNCLVFPSYREGFPNVVMQAGAMGISSIVTDINGCNEIIITGENGIIIPKKDETALLKAMESVYHQEQNNYSQSYKYREMIINRYDQLKVWNSILEEYRNLEKKCCAE